MRFTTDELVWRPWVEPVEASSATPEQVEALGETKKPSPYYRVLAHVPAALRSRTRLYDGIMYHRGGLPRADRELAATAASMTNGCVYCVSVHARRLAQLTKDPGFVAGLIGESPGAHLDERRRAIVDFARALTAGPSDVGPAGIRPLREAGLSDEEIEDLVRVVALFGWANRLMQSLGAPEPQGG
ncbi:peroxidase-related enzyme [Actinomadura vinacea]|uniref:Peroxidase-related enzyme n=1 Tax=Actinomadura vinacea TaxID=115336 RepID=A0ABN3KE46_9ACTN